jgi:RNA polymerase sigma-70 factor (ECF subfamily)
MKNRFGAITTLFRWTDEEAMERLQTAHDHRAFTTLVERWEEPVLRLCARMLGDLARAEDLKQETFARVFLRRNLFRSGMRFSTWLWRIALNLCYDELRKSRRRSESPLPEEENCPGDAATLFATAEDPPDLQVAVAEENELVRRALLMLPESARAVLLLRFCEDLKLREIAAVLDVSESTARDRLADGLLRMSRLLQPSLAPSPQSTVPPDLRALPRAEARL